MSEQDLATRDRTCGTHNHHSGKYSRLAPAQLRQPSLERPQVKGRHELRAVRLLAERLDSPINLSSDHQLGADDCADNVGCFDRLLARADCIHVYY